MQKNLLQMHFTNDLSFPKVPLQRFKWKMTQPEYFHSTSQVFSLTDTSDFTEVSEIQTVFIEYSIPMICNRRTKLLPAKAAHISENI